MATFSERLRMLREERKMGQKEVASLLGLTYSSIGKYETDSRQPPLHSILRLAEFFQVSTDFLLGRSNIRLSAEEVINEHENMIADLPSEAKKEISTFVEFIREKYKSPKS